MEAERLNLQALALNDLGAVQHLTGDYSAATASFGQALRTYTSLGNRQGEAETPQQHGRNGTGHLGDSRREFTSRKALAIAISITAPVEETRALEGIGRCQLLDGRTAEGVASLRRSLAIFERISSPNAQRVAALLQEQRL